MLCRIRVGLSGKPVSQQPSVASRIIGRWKEKHDGLAMITVRSPRPTRRPVLIVTASK